MENEAETKENDCETCNCITKVLNDLIDCAFLKSTLPTSSTNQSETNIAHHATQPSDRVILSQPELTASNRNYQVYRAVGGLNSTGLVHGSSPEDDGLDKPRFAVSLTQIPPSYSTVIKFGPLRPRRDSGIDIHPSIPFLSRVPPPSYAEVQGIYEDVTSASSSENLIFGPEPIYTICPRCSAIVITETFTRRSNVTYLTSLLLCLCLCWPCCILPFCTNSCNEVYHTCPNCNYYFGMYRPW